jgi:hypothetical protein
MVALADRVPPAVTSVCIPTTTNLAVALLEVPEARRAAPAVDLAALEAAVVAVVPDLSTASRDTAGLRVVFPAETEAVEDPVVEVEGV